jgi:hypothetical protein
MGGGGEIKDGWLFDEINTWMKDVDWNWIENVCIDSFSWDIM